MDLLKKKFENYEIYKNFCDSISCEQGCFLKYLKLNNELKELIWKKFGAQNVYLGEIKELYFEKLFSIFKFDPCRISKFLRILDKKNNIDYEVSCFSVKKNIFKNFFQIYFKLLNKILSDDYKTIIDYNKIISKRELLHKKKGKKVSLDTKRFKNIQEQAQNSKK